MYKLLAVAVMLWVLIFGYEFHTENNVSEVVVAPEQVDYHKDTQTVVEHVDNYCATLTQKFPIKIQVVYLNEPHEPVDYSGRWHADTNQIELVSTPHGLSIEVIAHEVYHMVQTMMERYAIEDDHYGAYLQGKFTSCVLEIVQNDI